MYKYLNSFLKSIHLILKLRIYTAYLSTIIFTSLLLCGEKARGTPPNLLEKYSCVDCSKLFTFFFALYISKIWKISWKYWKSILVHKVFKYLYSTYLEGYCFSSRDFCVGIIYLRYSLRCYQHLVRSSYLSFKVSHLVFSLGCYIP